MTPLLVAAFLAALLVGAILLQTRRAHEDDEAHKDSDERLDRIRSELQRLGSENPVDVRDATNRLLSLGPGVIPALCEWLKSIEDQDAGPSRAHQAVVEELIASFGMNAAAPLSRALRRVVFPSPMIAASVRALRRIGDPALPVLIEALAPENVVSVGLVLHRCPGIPEPRVLRVLPSLSPVRLQRALRVFGGVLEHHCGPVVELFDGGDTRLRRGLVDFYGRWPTPLAAKILVRSLDDTDPTLRQAGARGIGLLTVSPPTPLSKAVHDSAPAVRCAALLGLSVLDASDAQEAIVRVLAEGPPAEQALAALVAAELPVSQETDAVLERVTSSGEPVASIPAAVALATRTGTGPSADAALDAVQAHDETLRRAAARALALCVPNDVRARERAILLAESEDAVVRAIACAALARTDLRDLPALLANAVKRFENDPEEHFHLRAAALSAGDRVVTQLARLVRTAPQPVAILAAELAASTGSDAALEGLLRSLPHRRGTIVGMVVRSHAAAFGPRALVVAAELLAADSGLLPQSACEFLLQYGDKDACEALLDSLTRSEGHRSSGLAALECIAATHPHAVLSALERRRGAPADEWVRKRIGLH